MRGAARIVLAGALVVGLASGGCTVRAVQPAPKLVDGRWMLLPFANRAETPRAGERVESILATLWRVRGLSSLETYVPEGPLDVEVDDAVRTEKALAFAREHGIQYALTGSVQEWRYRAGLDGEPAVSVSLSIIEVPTGKVVWSASGARSGWGRDTVSGIAHGLLDDLISVLHAG